MKQTKKIFSIVLAIALAFAMMIPAFAAEETTVQTGSITINSAANVSVDGKVFKAYKILDAKAVNVNDLNDGVVYSIPAEMQEYYDELLEKGDEEDATIAEVEAYINDLTDDELLAFAKAALAAAKEADVEAKEATGADSKATFSAIPFGYYVIEDTTNTDGAVVSAVMLDTTNDVELTLKADKPSITKKIDGATDGDDTTDGLVDYNTATVGEEVPYVLTSKVPDMTGYTSYTYVVTDTLSDGLTFVDGDDEDTIVDVVVTVNDTEYNKVTVEQDGQKMTITFTDMLSLTKDDEIKITYKAVVNKNAVIGVEGNPNTVNLKYSNNPQETTSTATTPDDITRTYLVDLIVNKTDDDDKALAGAGFAVVQDGKTIATGTSDENGKVTFTWTNGVGLKDGETYTITETVVPDGYNKAADVTFTVTCTDPAADATSQNCVWSSNNTVVTFTATEGNAADYFETTIKNSTGALLPETGGMGTTMFYIIGAVMVIGAVVVMVSKKRMAFEA